MRAGAVALEPSPGRGAAPRIVADAVSLATRMPDLVVAARRIALSLTHGLHGRRRAGPGEDFWQYRRFSAGEAAHLIDWRRSARDDHLHVREKEWESAHTVWIWVDLSASMQVRSTLAAQSKRDRAVLVALALAETLVRAGERVGLLGLGRPSASRSVVDRFVETLIAAEAGASSLPPRLAVARFSEVLLIGDLLDPGPQLIERFDAITAEGATLALAQVLDPIEETFPFDGRVEFVEPESGRRFLAGRAEGFRDAYLERLKAHRTVLAGEARRRGHPLIVHHTDRAPSDALLALIGRLGAPGVG